MKVIAVIVKIVKKGGKVEENEELNRLPCNTLILSASLNEVANPEAISLVIL